MEGEEHAEYRDADADADAHRELDEDTLRRVAEAADPGELRVEDSGVFAEIFGHDQQGEAQGRQEGQEGQEGPEEGAEDDSEVEPLGYVSQ